MKKQLVIGLGLLLMSALQAQEPAVKAQEPIQYLHVDLGGGLSNLSYQLKEGSKQAKMGCTFNVGYSYFFTPQWGVTAGLGIQSFNGQGTVNMSTADKTAIDGDNANYEFRVKYDNWKEKQSVLMFEIPIAVQYKHPLDQKFALLGSLGAKIAFPLTKTYASNGGSFTTTGYYAKYGTEALPCILHDLPGRFETTTDKSGDLSLKAAMLTTVEAGALYKLNEKFDLYFGAYFNYGLNNISKTKNQPIYDANKTYNGLIASTDKVIPVSLGVKVGVYLKLGKTAKNITEKKLPEKILIDSTAIKDSLARISAAQVVVVNPVVEQKTVVVEPVVTQKPDTIAETKPVISEPVVSPEPVAVPEEKPIVEKPVVEEPVVAEEPAVVSTNPTQPVVMDQGKPRIIQNETKEVISEAMRRAASLQYRFGFDFGREVDIENSRLMELAEILKTHPKLVLRIVGHTCNLGSHESNLKIGLRRAEIVKASFVQLGVEPKQLITESKSFDEPLVPNSSKLNRRKNRRVAFEILNMPPLK